MLRGYERAALTMNFIRALIDGGFADLHHPEYWDLGLGGRFAAWPTNTGAWSRSIGDSLRFMETLCGAAGRRAQPGRLLHQPRRRCTCPTSRRRRGEVPRQRGLVQPLHAFPLDRHAHRAIQTARTSNISAASAIPIAVKVGPAGDARPAASPDRRAQSARRARAPDPDPPLRRGQASRECLPPLLDAVRSERQDACCGAAIRCTATPRPPANGIKTRRFDNILQRTRAGVRHPRRRRHAIWAACTSSSPAKTSPSAWAARAGSPRPDLERAYARSSIPGSTTSRHWRWRC